MQEMIKLLIGIGALILGFFIGGFLAWRIKDELKAGQKWFKLIIILGLLGALIGLIFASDTFFFTFSFIAIVMSRCLRK